MKGRHSGASGFRIHRVPATRPAGGKLLIPPRFLATFFGVRPSGVLHVGAHRAEEFGLYASAGFGRTLWVEAQPGLIPEIEQVISGSGDELYFGCVWGETGREHRLRIASNSASTSLFDFGEHRDAYPEITTTSEVLVRTTRLDELIPVDRDFDFVTLDIQGAELEALIGLGDRIESVRWIYTEVSRRPLYAGAPLVDELDQFLASRGFRRTASSWKSAGWGDALYTREPAPLMQSLRNHAGRAVLWGRDALGLPKSAKRLRNKVFRLIDRLRAPF